MKKDGVWHPKHIVLDSTELVADIGLTSPRIAILRAYCQQFGSRLVIPRVVRLEVHDKIATLVKTAVTSLERATEDFRRASTRVEPELATQNASQLVKDAQERLVERLKWLGASDLALPDVPHDEVLERLLSRRRPFGTEKHKEVGYRDYLLWRNVLSLEGPTAFVSSNSKDFAAGPNSKEDIHPDLADDIEAGALEVVYFCGLGQLIERALRPKFPSIGVSDIVVDYSANKRRLEEFIARRLKDEIKWEATNLLLERAKDVEAEKESVFWSMGDIDREEVAVSIGDTVITTISEGIDLQHATTVSFKCTANIDVSYEASRDFRLPEGRDGVKGVGEEGAFVMEVEIEFTADVEGEVLTPRTGAVT